MPDDMCKTASGSIRYKTVFGKSRRRITFESIKCKAIPGSIRYKTTVMD